MFARVTTEPQLRARAKSASSNTPSCGKENAAIQARCRTKSHFRIPPTGNFPHFDGTISEDNLDGRDI